MELGKIDTKASVRSFCVNDREVVFYTHQTRTLVREEQIDS